VPLRPRITDCVESLNWRQAAMAPCVHFICMLWQPWAWHQLIGVPIAGCHWRLVRQWRDGRPSCRFKLVRASHLAGLSAKPSFLIREENRKSLVNPGRALDGADGNAASCSISTPRPRHKAGGARGCCEYTPSRLVPCLSKKGCGRIPDLLAKTGSCTCPDARGWSILGAKGPPPIRGAS
jgi:hypothetical protein